MSIGAVPQDCSARAVSKQHAGIPILPVHDRRELLRTDDQHGVVGARHDELLCHLQGIDESRARSFEVKSRSPIRADLALDQRCRRRKGHVRGDRGDDNEFDVLRADPGLGHRFQGGLRAQVRSKFILRRNVALLDPGPRGNPLISRIYHFLQIGVGENFGRDIRSDAGDRTGAALEIKTRARVPEFRFGSWTHLGTRL